MTSQNNPLTAERGSALIVTMLLISVLLVTALILLQRIIPYAKSVRSMHDASQAYYVARGQADLARHNFFYSGGGGPVSLQFPSMFGLLAQQDDGTVNIVPTGKRKNIFAGYTVGTVIDDQVQFKLPVGGTVGDPTIPEIGLPFRETGKQEDAVVISLNNKNPLEIKLFSTNTTTEKFGTSKTNGLYHTLYARNAGGLRFDLRGIPTDSMAQESFKLKFSTLVSATITLKMQCFLSGNSTVKTFTKEYTVSNSDTLTLNQSSGDGNIQEITSSGSINPGTGTFHSFLTNNDCSNATICSLTLTLNPGGPNSIDFQILADQQIPDLNAIVIGDGLSPNRIYYQRVIDLIPTPQDI